MSEVRQGHTGSGTLTATPMGSAMARRYWAGLLTEILSGSPCAQRLGTFQGRIKPENGADRLLASPVQAKIGKVSKLPENSLRVSR
jgi:hypothetical protein